MERWTGILKVLCWIPSIEQSVVGLTGLSFWRLRYSIGRSINVPNSLFSELLTESHQHRANRKTQTTATTWTKQHHWLAPWKSWFFLYKEIRELFLHAIKCLISLIKGLYFTLCQQTAKRRRFFNCTTPEFAEVWACDARGAGRSALVSLSCPSP